MKFLSKAAIQALRPKESLVSLLKQNMGGYQRERSHKVVHASDVTKPEFCARQFALLDATDKYRPDVFVGAALQATFDHGHAVSNLVREKWLGDAALGNWECVRCHSSRTFCAKPEDKGCSSPGSSRHLWKYGEMVFDVPEYGVSGSLDVVVQMGGLKAFAVECKIMAPAEWEKIIIPLAEHRVRTSLYLRLVKDSESPYKDKIHHGEAWVLYVSRAYGKKHVDIGQVLPFKAFKVSRDDAACEPLLAKGKLVKIYRDTGIMPPAICGSQADKFAKACPMAKECFSGKYPAGQKCVS